MDFVLDDSSSRKFPDAGLTVAFPGDVFVGLAESRDAEPLISRSLSVVPRGVKDVFPNYVKSISIMKLNKRKLPRFINFRAVFFISIDPSGLHITSSSQPKT